MMNNHAITDDGDITTTTEFLNDRQDLENAYNLGAANTVELINLEKDLVENDVSNKVVLMLKALGDKTATVESVRKHLFGD